MTELVIFATALLLAIGGAWAIRAGNAGAGGLLFILCVIVIVAVVLRLLGIWI